MDLPTRIQQGARITMPMPGADRRGPTGNILGDIGNLMLKEGVFDTAKNTGKAALGIAGKPWSPTRWKEAIGENLGIKGVFGQTPMRCLPSTRAARPA